MKKYKSWAKDGGNCAILIIYWLKVVLACIGATHSLKVNYSSKK